MTDSRYKLTTVLKGKNEPIYSLAITNKGTYIAGGGEF